MRGSRRGAAVVAARLAASRAGAAGEPGGSKREGARKRAKGAKDGSGGGRFRVAVVVSRYNGSVTEALEQGATDEASAAMGAGETGGGVSVYRVPGAFEVPAACLAAARSGRFDGIVALGCIIKGQTKHDEYLAHAVTSGLVRITIETGVPIGLGVLTVETAKQAHARAGGKHGNKGAEAMRSLLETLREIERIRSGAAAGEDVADRAAAPDKARRGAAGDERGGKRVRGREAGAGKVGR